MKFGIVGSSYSVGKHHNFETGTNDLAEPFEMWLEKYTDGVEFINAACAGKGTELYLNKVVYLKDKFDIDGLLIEFVNNRSMLNFKCLPEKYTDIYRNENVDELEENVYRSSETIWPYMRALIQDMEEENFSPSSKKFECWKEVQWNIASVDAAMEFWGSIDIYQTIKLCNMLNIKCVSWSKTWSYQNLPSFDNILQGSKYVRMGDSINAHEYYVDKYGLDNILCDHDHFNDAVNEEMVKDFIAPAIMEAKDG